MIADSAENSILPIIAESIPGELKVIPHWLLWKRVDRNGKPSKLPYQATGALARVNDPTTWTDFESALKAYQRGGFDGVGFALDPARRIVGVDLDKCLNPDTGELDPEAARIVAELPTYCEVSPSGRGLRLFGLGTLPQGGRRKGLIELYDEGRYLTVTGHRFNGHDALADIAAPLAQVHARIFGADSPDIAGDVGMGNPPPVDSSFDLDDAALFAKARNARNGAEFDRLFAGDCSGHDGDHSAADQALCNLLAFWTGNDAARMDQLFRQSGLFRPKWDTVHFADGRTYGQATIARAIAGCRETYGGRRRGPARQDAGEPGKPGAVDDSIALDAYRGTDDANAELFLTMRGADVRYCPPWEKWLLWSGSHWRIDDRLDIDRLAADVPRQLYQRAGDAADSGERRKIAALASRLERTTLRATMLIAARHRVVVHHSDLDKGRFLLNAANGTVDLRTGRLRPHDRADLITHDTEINYQPDAAAPTWLRFLGDVFANDSDLIQFVQRAIGYSLTGDVREQVLLICHGVGSNGKSVFLNILRKLLGALAWQAAPDLLLADKQRRHPTEQADLFGKRAVICQETGEGRRFNETLVKQLTGGDVITARRMHEDNWSFEPTHKLWLSTNHRPEIRGTDYAIWRRIRLIPFGIAFTDEGEPRKDPLMETRLTAELPGILAWAVRGCLDWQQHGLGMAKAVQDATTAYQTEQDVLAAWIADCCIVGKRFEAKAADLYASYGTWCDASGETAEPQRRFGMRLTERGFTRQRRMVGIFWRGIGLKSSDHVPNEPYEPEKAVSRADISRGSQTAESGSFHTYPTYEPPASPPSQHPDPPLWKSSLTRRTSAAGIPTGTGC